ncbi:MAG: DUF5777 family beta-barrel protein [Flavobacteriaceae bacterium]|nr:DUF5777 family beta-barrel protein [Flavobacteriaceae bacterium]
MKNYISIFFAFLMLPLIGIAQESNVEKDTVVKVKEKLERPAFESSNIIDNPTNVVLSKNTLEVQMNHRFGTLGSWEDLGGIWAPANIRLGAAYGVHERVTLGFGTIKNKRYQELNWKAALLRQTRSEKMPISLTYYGNFAYDARVQENTNFNYHQDRYSYFHQLILVRRFSPEFSVQATGSVSHYNTVDVMMRNDMLAFSLGGRYKISPNTSILIDYSQPITKFKDHNPNPGFSLGVEFGTSAHAFQIFVSNYQGILPQENYVYNSNDFFDGDVLLGFTITRLYNF